MPSRKRAQGQAWRVRGAAPPGRGRANVCRHWCSRLDSAQQQVVDTFVEEWSEVERGVAMKDTSPFINKHPELFQIDENQSLMHSWLVSRGTDDLLRQVNKNHPKFGVAQINAFMLLFLEGSNFTKENTHESFDSGLSFLKHRESLLKDADGPL